MRECTRNVCLFFFLWLLSFSMCLSFLSYKVELKKTKSKKFYFKDMFDLGTGIFSSAKRNKERSAVCKLYGAKNSVAYSITFSGFIIKTD